MSIKVKIIIDSKGKEVDYYPRDVYRSSRGLLHRCKTCWVDSECKELDNGFISGDIAYPHAENCKWKGRF